MLRKIYWLNFFDDFKTEKKKIRVQLNSQTLETALMKIEIALFTFNSMLSWTLMCQ